jgi:hypothetical protein
MPQGYPVSREVSAQGRLPRGGRLLPTDAVRITRLCRDGTLPSVPP